MNDSDQAGAGNAFERRLAACAIAPLTRRPPRILQVNLGRVCNQSCRHCHVEAGPQRTESMDETTSDQVLRLLAASPCIERVELTGGAPELNGNFRRLARGARLLGKRVADRSNLTVFLLPGRDDLPGFLADHEVEIVASLPCYTRENVDRQRGDGTFEHSIAALRRLNRLGYGAEGSPLVLDLIYNPLDGFLPGPQTSLERDYRQALLENWGIRFNHLLTLTNMPIGRFGGWLRSQGEYTRYLSALADNFNAAAVSRLMCLDLVSVSWDGRLFDCDFNQALDMPLRDTAGIELSVRSTESLGQLEGDLVLTGPHCFGCTAAAGSSCGGTLVEN